jgi:hypothetical protein
MGYTWRPGGQVACGLNGSRWSRRQWSKRSVRSERCGVRTMRSGTERGARACGGAVAVGRVDHFAVQLSGRFKSVVGLHCSGGPGLGLIQLRAALLKWAGLWPSKKSQYSHNFPIIQCSKFEKYKT